MGKAVIAEIKLMVTGANIGDDLIERGRTEMEPAATMSLEIIQQTNFIRRCITFLNW